MKISEHTLSALSSLVTGNGELSPYRSGPDLVAFFNQFGRSDRYGEGFPSRWYYAEDCLRDLNDSVTMKEVTEAALDPRHFLGTNWDVQAAVDHLNQYLEYDGYELRSSGRVWIVCSITDGVDLAHPYPESAEITHVFISEQIDKCTHKLEAGDYDGAITNARSLLEAVLVAIESELDQSRPEFEKSTYFSPSGASGRLRKTWKPWTPSFTRLFSREPAYSITPNLGLVQVAPPSVENA